MLGIVGIVSLLILPLQAWVLDALLALSIALAFVVLLTATYMLRPLDFSVFPSVLLLTTLFRLGLNVASTRLILNGATQGRAEAGRIIATFGELVVGGSTVVGIVVFLILVIINFMVITKGAGRIAEVSARFTLDALPGKQMAIDAELANGALTEAAARARRSEVERESDFYGAMDGASKFVRGDAIAGLLITAINILGGLIVASTQGGLSLAEAFRLYTLLTVGDGLVAQIPALLISTAAGIIVTRAAGSGALGEELAQQMLQDRRVLWGAAAAVGGLGLIPGMPMLLFVVLASGLGVLAWQTQKESVAGRASAEAEAPEPSGVDEEVRMVREAFHVQPLTLELGLGLVSLVQEGTERGDLVWRIRQMRQTFARELGVAVPPVHVRDDLTLAPGGYRLLLRDVVIGEAELMPLRLLAIDPGTVRHRISGTPTQDPTFGLAAIWIASEDRVSAEAAGYTVVDPEGVIITHIGELIRQHASELFGWQELHERLDQLREEAPRLVSDLVPDLVPHSTLLRVLRALLAEGLSIRDLRGILEALAERAGTGSSASLSALVDHVRARLRDQIGSLLAGDDGALRVAMLERSLEEELRKKLISQEGEPHLACDLQTAQLLFEQIELALPSFAAEDAPPVLLAPADLRQPLKGFLAQFFPQLAVVSHREIPSRRRLISIAQLGVQTDRSGPLG
jgi:flagellar biosynthesis protein FlhA